MSATNLRYFYDVGALMNAVRRSLSIDQCHLIPIALFTLFEVRSPSSHGRLYQHLDGDCTRLGLELDTKSRVETHPIQILRVNAIRWFPGRSSPQQAGATVLPALPVPRSSIHIVYLRHC